MVNDDNWDWYFDTKQRHLLQRYQKFWTAYPIIYNRPTKPISFATGKHTKLPVHLACATMHLRGETFIRSGFGDISRPLQVQNQSL
jgi:hypothetical protein